MSVITEETSMVPLKPSRINEMDLGDHQLDESTWGHQKPPMMLPVLDLSKFPSKKKLGEGTPLNRIGLKIPRKTELGMGKSSSSQRTKGTAPQVVRAPKPARNDSTKVAGSMAFAHRARGADDSYDKWMIAELPKLSLNSMKGTGRYGRLTSIEKDVMELEEQTTEVDRAADQDAEPVYVPEDESYLDDPRNSASSMEYSDHSWVVEHECEPPKMSFDETDVGSSSGGGLIGFEPPRMSLGDFTQEYHSPFLADDTAARIVDQESREQGGTERGEMQGQPSHAVSDSSSQPAKLRRIGTVEDKLEFRYSHGGSVELLKEDLQLDSKAWRAVRGPEPRKGMVPKIPIITDDFEMEIPHAGNEARLGVARVKSPVKHGAQRWAHGTQRWAHGTYLASSLDCPPSPEAPEPVLCRSSFEEDSSQAVEPRVSCVSSCNASEIVQVYAEPVPANDDTGVTVQPSTGPTRRKRNKGLGIARRVLGVTLGITTSAVMLVSGVMVAKAIIGARSRRSIEVMPDPSPSCEEEPPEKRPMRVQAIQPERRDHTQSSIP